MEKNNFFILVVVVFLILFLGFYFLILKDKKEEKEIKNNNIENNNLIELKTENIIQENLKQENLNKKQNSFNQKNQSKKIFTLNEVNNHNSRESCYTIIRGEVFDLTSWISAHPGGEKSILNMCGKDATNIFLNQHGNQEKPEKTLKQFKIGVIKNE